MYLLVAGILAGAPACSSDQEQEYEVVTTSVPSQGVVTTIEEVSPDQFSIVSEEVVADVSLSRFIIHKMDGSIDTLTLEQSRALITPADTTQMSDQRGNAHSLGSVLWWGASGYMLGRMLSRPVSPYAYRDTRGYASGSSAGGTVSSTARTVTTRRPISGGRSGFFNSSRFRSGS